MMKCTACMLHVNLSLLSCSSTTIHVGNMFPLRVYICPRHTMNHDQIGQSTLHTAMPQVQYIGYCTAGIMTSTRDLTCNMNGAKVRPSVATTAGKQARYTRSLSYTQRHNVVLRCHIQNHGTGCCRRSHEQSDHSPVMYFKTPSHG